MSASYIKGIVEAIADLNDSDGSNMIDIKKVMQDKLPEGKSWQNVQFLQALKVGADNGDFISNKNLYKLPDAKDAKELKGKPCHNHRLSFSLKPKAMPLKEQQALRDTSSPKPFKEIQPVSEDPVSESPEEEETLLKQSSPAAAPSRKEENITSELSNENDSTDCNDNGDESSHCNDEKENSIKEDVVMSDEVKVKEEEPTTIDETSYDEKEKQLLLETFTALTETSDDTTTCPLECSSEDAIIDDTIMKETAKELMPAAETPQLEATPSKSVEAKEPATPLTIGKSTNDEIVMTYHKAVLEAIAELQQGRDSSIVAIKKVVKTKLSPDIEWQNSNFLRAMKKGILGGEFVSVKHYKLVSKTRKKLSPTRSAFQREIRKRQCEEIGVDGDKENETEA